MEEGKMEAKWYTLTRKKEFGTTVGVYEVILTVPRFNKLLKTHAMTRCFRTKASIIPVPDTPFRIKLVFIGRRNEVMEVYFISKYDLSIKWQLNMELGDFGEAFLTKNYYKIFANKWRYVCSLKDPGLKAEACIGILCLRFKFKICLKPEPVEMPTPQLSDDFQVLFTEGTYSDAAIKSIDGVSFKVHKNILATRSCVLKAHFEHDLEESKTNILETNFETEVLRDVLMYLYTDTAPRIDREPGKVLAAADFYQIRGLKDICEQALYKKLNPENAIETLLLAELHNAKNLKLQILDYIKYEGGKAITKTEGWKNNTCAELVKKIYGHMMDDVNMTILSVAHRQV